MGHGKKAPSRSALRHEALAQAQKVTVSPSCDVCIVGGGAAGLAAAIVAAEAGARVVVLERDLACGRTILATGNGRCNFCNADLDARHYNDPAFVERVAGPLYRQDVLEFFSQCGLSWVSEEGRLYPMSRQAASVRNVLLERARRSGALLAPAREVLGINRMPAGFELSYQGLWEPNPERSIRTQAVVIASGGGANQFATELHLPSRAPKPVLCPLACRDSPLLKLDGRRVHATATLWRDGRRLHSEAGEVLFRPYGLSGIVMFDLSRRAQPGDTVTLDLLPGLARPQAERLVRDAGTFDGILDPVIAHTIEGLAQKEWWEQACGVPKPSDADGRGYALSLAEALPLVVEGIAEPQRAQVQRGGLSTRGFRPSTLESREAPGIFACGEALDVDGDCGGYNLAWAWKSGMVAGKAAAGRAMDAHPTRGSNA